MGPSIHLLGVPRIVMSDGTLLALRGYKAWGLLAYLVIHREVASRQHLAHLLFEDAEDPMAALRWNLTELRRALGRDSLRGASISLERNLLSSVDLDVLMRGRSSDGAQLRGIGRELLEGLAFPSSPSFEVWLQAERRRMQATSQAVLHEAALDRLAAEAFAEAVSLAERLVALNPLDENAQVLLVRCLAAAGDGIGAARQSAACIELFRRELGVVPGPALAAALHTVTSKAVSRAVGGRAGALAQIEAGEAAIGAGVLDAGLQCLRRAIADADTLGDSFLRTRARVALGGALVHAVRGRDGEGAAALHEALAIGTESAAPYAAAACRELGYVEFLLGRYERALAWLERAEPLADGDIAERARLTTLQGSILNDMAHYDASLERLRQACAWAAQADDAKQAIYAGSMLGRTLVLTGRMDEAAAVLDGCVAQAARMWTAFLPWPQSFRAEVDLLQGRIDDAANRFEHAFALGCQLADPCWEGIAGRGLGLVAAARGRHGDAIAILVSTLERSSRLPDGYVWGIAYVLDSLCDLAIAMGDARAANWIERLMTISAGAGMRELVVRCHRHRARLGVRGSAEAARFLASEIGNPVLAAPFV